MMCAYTHEHAEVTGQLAGVVSLLALSGARGLNPISQIWPEVPSSPVDYLACTRILIASLQMSSTTFVLYSC